VGGCYWVLFRAPTQREHGPDRPHTPCDPAIGATPSIPNQADRCQKLAGEEVDGRDNATSFRMTGHGQQRSPRSRPSGNIKR
jgi:hypothetical protein